MYYALFNSSLNLSAIIAINSEFVGFPLAAEIVYPNMFSTTSCWPLPHATSIALVLTFFFYNHLCKILDLFFV